MYEVHYINMQNDVTNMQKKENLLFETSQVNFTFSWN